MPFDTPTLIGPTVTLRPLDRADVPALSHASSQHPERYMFSTVPQGVEETRVYVDDAIAKQTEGARMPFVIVFAGEVVGSTSYSDFRPWQWRSGCPLQRQEQPDAAEIGYTWLAAWAQRTRCNREAKLLLLEHAFEIWRVYRVSLRTDERNRRSREAIEGLGAKFEGIRRADMPGRDGTVRNSAYYSILAAEWPDVRASLHARLSG